MARRDRVKTLIADDETTFSDYLAMALLDLGYQIVGFAATDQQAAQLPKESRPGLLLMDVGLVGQFGGVEAAERIYKVTTACNGREAPEACRSNQGGIEFALLDFITPEMGGNTSAWSEK